jgi:DNA-binding LacI/PurR family transcriptional regulator
MAKTSRVRNIVDIAEKCGVSISTVSRALNNEPGISSRTRQKILKAAEQLKFTPKKRKRPRNRSNLDLMVVVPEQDELSVNPFFNVSELLGAINEAFRNEKKRIEIITVENFARFIDADRPDCDGILFAYRGVDDVLRRRLRSHEIPYIFLSRSIPDDNYVTCNNLKGVLGLVQYLAAHGHMKIGYFGNASNPNNADRLRGYRIGIAEAGVMNGGEVVFTGESSVEPAAGAAKFFIEHGCDAVACFNDYMAVSLINELNALGRNVPGDISVTGFDDSPLSRVSRPAVSTVALPTYEMAFLASRWLRDNIMNRMNRAIHIEVDGKMAIRESVRTRS